MAKIWGRVVVLVLLILILLAGAAIWFDYLGVIDIKTTLAGIYRIPFIARITGVQPRSQEPLPPDAFLDLNAERLAVRLEALDLRSSEMDNQETAIAARQVELEQMAAELEERQRMLDEREMSLEARRNEAESYDRNIDQLARYLSGMPPDAAVGILNDTEDQKAIDIIRKVEEIAQESGTASIVSYWFSQMTPARAAELQRKMASRP
ncbi:MAG: flagellar protein FlbB [Spirochaetaceae bacterium]|jgi:flagellar protein FlbB|nr:flagellar protein FlbB [Spirochaetaceae bacterium]